MGVGAEGDTAQRAADAPTPTNGFSIKAVQLDRVIFNVKELGGSDKFRPYWDKYYSVDVDGIVSGVCAMPSVQERDGDRVRGRLGGRGRREGR